MHELERCTLAMWTTISILCLTPNPPLFLTKKTGIVRMHYTQQYYYLSLIYNMVLLWCTSDVDNDRCRSRIGGPGLIHVLHYHICLHTFCLWREKEGRGWGGERKYKVAVTTTTWKWKGLNHTRFSQYKHVQYLHNSWAPLFSQLYGGRVFFPFSLCPLLVWKCIEQLTISFTECCLPVSPWATCVWSVASRCMLSGNSAVGSMYAALLL